MLQKPEIKKNAKYQTIIAKLPAHAGLLNNALLAINIDLLKPHRE
jgi:hypothetical protein